MVVYLAGKYSGDIDANIAAARKVAIDLWERGYAVICPHLNTAHFEVDCKATYDDYITGDLHIISRCDVVVMLPGWKDSKGANLEHAHATEMGIPIYEYPNIPDLHPTEVKCPRQSRAFLREIMKMWRTHLDKNADYSPANILATGELGLVTRLWDKTARLLNLYGFRFTVEKGSYDQPKAPKYESIEDTLRDSAVYSVIGLLLRRDEWGN